MTSFTYDIVTPDARGSVQAFRRSVGEVGSFSGPILGGLVAGLSHAGMAFAVFAPLHLMSALMVAVVARETLNRMPRAEPRPVAGPLRQPMLRSIHRRADRDAGRYRTVASQRYGSGVNIGVTRTATVPTHPT